MAPGQRRTHRGGRYGRRTHHVVFILYLSILECRSSLPVSGPSAVQTRLKTDYNHLAREHHQYVTENVPARNTFEFLSLSGTINEDCSVIQRGRENIFWVFFWKCGKFIFFVILVSRAFTQGAELIRARNNTFLQTLFQKSIQNINRYFH